MKRKAPLTEVVVKDIFKVGAVRGFVEPLFDEVGECFRNPSNFLGCEPLDIEVGADVVKFLAVPNLKLDHPEFEADSYELPEAEDGFIVALVSCNLWSDEGLNFFLIPAVVNKPIRRANEFEFFYHIKELFAIYTANVPTPSAKIWHKQSLLPFFILLYLFIKSINFIRYLQGVVHGEIVPTKNKLHFLAILEPFLAGIAESVRIIRIGTCRG